MHGTSKRRGLFSRRQQLAIGLAVISLAAACGSQHSHDELVEAYRDSVGARGANGTTADSREPGQAVTPGAATNTPIADAGPPGAGGGAPTGGGSAGGSTAGGDDAVPADATGQVVGAACTEQRATINIGTVGEQSGIAGSAVAAGTRAVSAWVAMINARGGINCHPLRYIVTDDGADPAQHQALVQKLVEEDRILAIVFMNAVIPGQASVEYLTNKRIPVIGNEGGEGWFYTSPVYFPQQGTGDVALKGLLSAAAQIGKDKNVGTLSCIEAPACSRLADVGPVFAQQVGVRLVYSGKASIAQPDYTSVCQAAQRAGVQTWIVVLDPNSLSRVGRSCATVGYRPQYVVYGGSSNLQTGDDPNLNGVVVGMPTIPWMLTDHPGVAEFTDALARFAPGVPAEPITITAWVAAKLFERATQNIPEPPTSEGILAGLWSIKGDDLGGMTQPLTFTKGQNAPLDPTCNWLAQAVDGTWITPNGGQRTCI